MPVENPLLSSLVETDELVIERDPRQPSIWLVHHRETRLIVGTAPWSAARFLLGRSEFQHPSCYALVGETCLLLGAHGTPDGRMVPGTHVGRTGQPPVRARQHRSAPPLAAMRTITVISIDNGKGLLLDEAAALEQALHIAAMAAGSHEVVSRPPRDRGLSPGVLTRVRRWLATLRWMLRVARCDILEPKYDHADLPGGQNDNAPAEPEATALPPSAGWTRDFPNGLLNRPDAQRFRLVRNEVTASALVVAGWCILEAGSLARADEIPSIQDGLRNKRRELLDAGVLKPVPGRRDVLETTEPVGVPSLTNLARLLLGNNAGHELWQEVA